MAQTFTTIPATQSLQSSRTMILDRDDAAASNFSGTAFPSSGLIAGMLCHRTDLGKLYSLKDTTPTWIEVCDVSGASGKAPTATKLATARTIGATGDATATGVAFDGSANISLALTLAASGVTAGTYSKVTVDAKGRVTAGAALANGDLPGDISVTTLSASSVVALTLASTTHGLKVGADGGANLSADTGNIQARSNGAAAALGLNTLGGGITIGAAGAAVTIPAAPTVTGNTTLGSAGGAQVTTIHGTIAGEALATQAEAEAGTINDHIVTPLRIAQYVTARVATQAEAEAGTNTTKLMTPLRVYDAIDARTSPDALFTYESAAAPADFPTGAFAALNLNTTKVNKLGITLSGNSLTFANAGNYYCEAVVTCRNASGGGRSAAIKLQNTTVGAVEINGTGFNNANAGVATCHICGVFTVAAGDVLQLQGLANGLSLQNGDETDLLATNVYSIIRFWRKN